MQPSRSSWVPLLVRSCVSLLLCVAVAAAVVAYPLGWAVPAAVLVIYAALLWWRPSAFLIVLPVVIPALDFGLWTGWTLVDESDVFILASLAVLLVRTPPSWRDLAPRGIAGWVLGAFAAAWSIAIVVGLLSPLDKSPSDNVFLQPENALRVGKSLVEALTLLPFLCLRQRQSGDAMALFSRGLVTGLLVVTVAVVAERLLFADLLDFSGTYRVAGPFSSMRLGGGYIGAYTALVLPFTLCLVTIRPRWAGAAALLVSLAAGTYTLAATLARTAYAAGVIGLCIASAAWLRSARIGNRPLAAGLLPILFVIGALGGVAAFTGMRARFADAATDFSTREDNWRGGLTAARRTDPLSTVFGMGLGTYPRAIFEHSPVNRPGDVALQRDGARTVLVMRFNAPFYLGQKIHVEGAPIRIQLQARAAGAHDDLTVILCDKLILYSDQCRSAGLNLAEPGVWQSMDVTLDTHDLGREALSGLLHRPVELSIFGGPGEIEVTGLNATDAAGRPVLANADFAHGLDRWLITDDNHLSWRMKNVYLMLFFETGLFGVAAYLALCGAAMTAGLSGGLYGTAITGSVAAFLVSGLFDHVLEAPRIATLFFLIVGCAFVATASQQTPRPGSDA
jgi:hypothetical protein